MEDCLDCGHPPSSAAHGEACHNLSFYTALDGETPEQREAYENACDTLPPEMMGERPDLPPGPDREHVEERPTEWEGMWDGDEPLECGIENPEACEACG